MPNSLSSLAQSLKHLVLSNNKLRDNNLAEQDRAEAEFSKRTKIASVQLSRQRAGFLNQHYKEAAWLPDFYIVSLVFLYKEAGSLLR